MQPGIRETLLFALLMIAAWQDVRTGKVTNRLIAVGLVLGLLFQIAEHQIRGIYYFLGNISVPVILLYLLFQMRVLGAGDIKLFSMTGGILTIGELFGCIVYSFMAAAFGAVLFLLCDHERPRKLWHAADYLIRILRTGRIEPYRTPEKAECKTFAFAVFILFGTFAALYYPIGK